MNGVSSRHVWDRGNIVLEIGSGAAITNRFDRGIFGELIRSEQHGHYLFNKRGDVVLNRKEKDMPNGTWLLIFFIMLVLLAIFSIRHRHIYKKIRNTGVHGFGRVISCKRSFLTTGGIAVIPRYTPIIAFEYNGKHYEMEAMGSFGVRHGKAGDEIAIIFSEEYPDKVVLKNRHILDSKLIEIGIYILITIIFVVVIPYLRSVT